MNYISICKQVVSTVVPLNLVRATFAQNLQNLHPCIFSCGSHVWQIYCLSVWMNFVYIWPAFVFVGGIRRKAASKGLLLAHRWLSCTSWWGTVTKGLISVLVPKCGKCKMMCTYVNWFNWLKRCNACTAVWSESFSKEYESYYDP